jgi:hypothetical protein
MKRRSVLGICLLVALAILVQLGAVGCSSGKPGKSQEGGYEFANMDPAEAAKQMQAKSDEVKAIMVWNPFVLQTLQKRPEGKRLFDSTKIPEEIIDMVVVGEDVLKKKGGESFACAIIDVYYEFNKMLADPKQRDDLLVALGQKFSSLGLEEMKQAVDQTRFYKTADDGLNLFTGTGKLSNRKLPDTMKIVVDFYVSHKFVKKAPKIGYGGGEEVDLRFDPSYMKKVKDQKPTKEGGGDGPTFTLAWSEYPSWSVFGVAKERGLLDKIAKKWGVNIKLELLSYETCIGQYQGKTVDAVCITNMDVLNPAGTRNSVAILPTSTSYGADACLVVGIKDVDELKKYKTYGLKESVSEYAFYRVLHLLGKTDE